MATNEQKKRILGVDLGLKRTGLALSDEIWLTTRSLPTLTPKKRSEDISALLLICKKNDVGFVVIGFPAQAPGKNETLMSKRAKNFALELAKEVESLGLNLEVTLIDEFLSSRKASDRLVQSGIRKSKRKSALDGESARVLIEDFIASQGER